MKPKRPNPSVWIIVALGLLISGSQVSAQPAASDPGAADGYRMYMREGCYACHGTTGAGSGRGPKLAPTPLPYPVLLRQMRRPRARMPAYSDLIISDQDVQQIDAYLRSIPKGKPAAAIPLLMEP